MKSKKVFNNFGISIVEVIVAILIITMGMVGVLSLVIQNIQAQYINKNILIASGLAQEGLELVRNVRDLNWLTSGYAWDRDIDDSSFAIDYRGRVSINPFADGFNYIGTKLWIDNSNGFYTHYPVGNTITNFSRLIKVDNSHAEYLDVKCTIRWQEGTQNHDYTAETYLYNWR